MVKIEVGEAYMTGAKHLALVYSYQPDQFPADYKYPKHAYHAMLIKKSERTTFMKTFTEAGMYSSGPSMYDVVREATLEELYEYISENKSQLCEPVNAKYLKSFYKVWKEKNPL